MATRLLQLFSRPGRGLSSQRYGRRPSVESKRLVAAALSHGVWSAPGKTEFRRYDGRSISQAAAPHDQLLVIQPPLEPSVPSATRTQAQLTLMGWATNVY